MFFRRIAESIRTQNWFTVLIEIFVVVVGIFLGLQVDDWNEMRKYQREETVYLAKIRDDLDQMRNELEDYLERNSERKETMTAALEALESCDDSGEARKAVQFALLRYQTSPPVNYLDATYNEMVSSGALARIRDQELKSRIAQAFSRLGELNASLRGFRISIPVVDAVVWENVSYSFNRETNQPEVSFDINELCTNTMARNAFVEMIDIQHDGRASISRTLSAVDGLLQLLEPTASTVH